MDPVQRAPAEIETAVAGFSLGFSRHGLDLLMVRYKIDSVHIERQAECQSQNRESAMHVRKSLHPSIRGNSEAEP